MKRGSPDDQFGQEPHARIPESLIDAALDGEICDRMQEEIAHALRYDHHRRAELIETADAVRALGLSAIPMPDMQCAVLNRLDQHERFIPRSMRRWVRTGRMGIAAGMLLGLMVIAGLQSAYPRLTTIGAQSTPVHDVACAVEEDTQRVAQDVQSRVATVRASLSPLEGLLSGPSSAEGRTYASQRPYSVLVNNRYLQLTRADLNAFYESGVAPGEGLGAVSVPQRSASASMMLISYNTPVGGVGTQGHLLLTPQSGSGCVLVRTTRVERETRRDERIADLP